MLTEEWKTLGFCNIGANAGIGENVKNIEVNVNQKYHILQTGLFNSFRKLNISRRCSTHVHEASELLVISGLVKKIRNQEMRVDF